MARLRGVFLGEEGGRVVVRRIGHGAVKALDVAAGRERLAARAPDQNDVDRRIYRPGVQLAMEGAHHFQADRVQRLRPIERDEPEPAPALEQDVVARVHVLPPRFARSLRAMMTRMISLVPSRIWWTRTSRTFRSSGKSFR